MHLKFSVFFYVSFSVLRVVFHSFFFFASVFLLFSSVLVFVLFHFFLFVFSIFLPKLTTILEKSHTLTQTLPKCFPSVSR